MRINSYLSSHALTIIIDHHGTVRLPHPSLTSRLIPLEDGYHISELNFPESSITCTSVRSASLGGLPDCLGFNSTRYSAATAVFTLGGLAGSIMSSAVTRRLQATGSIKVTGLLNVVGSVMMFAAPHWLVVLAGR